MSNNDKCSERFFRKMDDCLANASLTASVLLSFSAFTDELLLGKGREVHINEGEGGEGCIIVDVNDDDENDESDYSGGDGGKRRGTSIEHCLHSIEQIDSAPLLVSRFHA